MDESFKNFGLSNSIVSRLEKIIGLNKPTEVQKKCIPEMLNGKNCVARSPTGSGKTMAFALPMIHKWSQDPYGVYGVVLTPTRELVSQIKEQFELVGGPKIRVASVIGGVDMLEQSLELQKIPHFVIATPGRLADHLTSGGQLVRSIFKNVRFLVYDEADRLLEGQFDEQLLQIIPYLSTQRQNCIFSATMSESLNFYVSKMSQSNYFTYDYVDAGTKVHVKHTIDQKRVSQKYVMCPPDFKDGYLVEVLRKIRDKELLPDVRSIILFAGTCKDCQVLSILLDELGFDNVVIHSNANQKTRFDSLVKFKSSQVPCLIATDVASRGLDIKSVDLVVHYSLPWPSDYVHRIGRTGRANIQGNSIIIMTPRDVQFLHKIEDYIGDKLKELSVNGNKERKNTVIDRNSKKLKSLIVTMSRWYLERDVLIILTEVTSKKKMAELKTCYKNHHEERKNTNKRKKLILELENQPDGKEQNAKERPPSFKKKIL